MEVSTEGIILHLPGKEIDNYFIYSDLQVFLEEGAVADKTSTLAFLAHHC